MSDKPLHVRVAEALGTHRGIYHNEGEYDFWGCESCGCACPRYDTDWRATGPLIERFRLFLRPLDDGGYMAEHYCGGVLIAARPGDTPCLAVCWVLLALADKFDLSEAGMLRGVPQEKESE